MNLTSEQLKGKIKNIAKSNNADARILIRIYMMERFLERLAASKYSENFIIKGGILVTSMIGVSKRSTMDIDASIRNVALTQEDIFRIISEIAAIDLNDGVNFNVKNIQNIMDDMEYPGIRLGIDATIEKILTPIKIDISTGDVITPKAIEYEYPLMLEDKTIRLWSYNLETILSEKLETILSRGLLNTRMRDFYDLHVLINYKQNLIKNDNLKLAFKATSSKRNSLELYNEADLIIESISKDSTLQDLWRSYQKKYNYANEISYEDIISSVKKVKAICID